MSGRETSAPFSSAHTLKANHDNTLINSKIADYDDEAAPPPRMSCKPAELALREPNGLTAGPFDEDSDLETSISYYKPKGGNLPVHLGDTLGQYKVIHKLAVSGAANVWLCRDTKAVETPMYCAVKPLPADDEKTLLELWIDNHIKGLGDQPHKVNLMLSRKYAKLRGPHGWYDLVVYPAWGAPIKVLLALRGDKNGGEILRRMSLQVVCALDALHDSDICHGDVSMANIFSGVRGLQDQPEDEVRKILGEPETIQITDYKSFGTTNKKHTETWAPQYMVWPVDWTEVDVSVIDIVHEAWLTINSFAYIVSDAPRYLVSNRLNAPPEYYLERKIGFGCDVWAMGCVLYQMRTGHPIFSAVGSENEILYKQCLILGKMPERWWWEMWDYRKVILEDQENDDGHVVTKGPYVNSYANTYGARSIKQSLKTVFDTKYGDVDDDVKPIPLEEEEINLFSDLLGKIFKWEPSKRITVKEMIDHPYFKYQSKGDGKKDEKT